MSQHATQSFKMRLTPGPEGEDQAPGSTQKEAVLAAVERELAAEANEEADAIEPQPGSFLEAAQDLCGSVEGPGDLSTNPKYMRDYGKD